MQIDTAAYTNLANRFASLANMQPTLLANDLMFRHQQIQNHLLSVASYLRNVSNHIQAKEKSQKYDDLTLREFVSVQKHVVSKSHYVNLSLASQILKRSNSMYASAGLSYAAYKATRRYACKYSSVTMELSAAQTSLKGSAKAILWKDKKFDPDLELKASASVSMLSGALHSRIGTSKLYVSTHANVDVGTAYAKCKAVLNKSEQSFEAGAGVAAVRGEASCIFHLFGATITLTGQGSLGSAEANLTYHHKNREWEFGSKLGFVAGLGFKVRINY